MGDIEKIYSLDIKEIHLLHLLKYTYYGNDVIDLS